MGKEKDQRGKRELPLYGCFVNSGWREDGMANVLVVRRMENGLLKFACYLVDIWGLGLKDVFGNFNFSERRLRRDFFERLERNTTERFIQIDPSLAKKLVWGGVEYARQNGFKVPQEFSSWEDVIGEPEADTCDWPVLFGVDGRPMIIGEEEERDLNHRLRQGPDDEDEDEDLYEEDEDEIDDEDLYEDDDDEDLLFDDDEEEEDEELEEYYEESDEADEILEVNDYLIEEFEDYLKSRRFNRAAIANHVEYLMLFSDDYLVGFEKGSLNEISKEEVVDQFLGEYFIRKVCEGKDDLEQMIRSLKSFYGFMAEREEGTIEEVRNAKEIIIYLGKEERQLYKKWKQWQKGDVN